MLTVRVREFLETGWFGPLRPGLTRAHVRAALGEPDAVFPDGHSIWKYGDIEFHFEDDTLWMIFTDHPYPGWPGGESDGLVVDPWVLHGALTLDEARAALRADGLPFENYTDLRGDLLRLPSGVELQFHEGRFEGLTARSR